MKVITKFVNTYTGEEFTNREKCLISINKSKEIKTLFTFWKKVGDEKGNCNFSNGHYCYQRTKEEYDQLVDIFFIAMKKYEKWICNQYDEQGGLKREYINGLSFVGRYLSDNYSELLDYWNILGCICPKCYREYGQSYYSINCTCNNEIPTKIIK